MRIVHEINVPMQVSGSGDRYIAVKGKNKKRKTGAGQVEILATEDCAANHPKMGKRLFNTFSVDETIYIEGDAEYVEKMLTDLLRVVKSIREMWK